MTSKPRAMPILDGPQTKHEQLRDLIAAEAIPGQMIPSERDLMARYQVSRATVRKAIDSLVVEGLLRRVQGKGTFAVTPRVGSHLHLASFTQDMLRRGFRPSTRVVGVELVEPPASIGRRLNMNPGEKAWNLTRVRLADGRPLAVEIGWYPDAIFPELGQHDLSGSLYEVFSHQYKRVIDRADQTLWGEAAQGARAHMLDAPVNTPLLVFERVSRSGRLPVECVVSYYRGDMYQVHMSLDNSQPAVER
ncbi:GntR family transcriptional regulator [Enemella sp. A6]|uniref:GntR family transcriptional regulator n=1 Tax=Enemella sp. A6 TaxID=3440152 RepID=UPI003EB92FEA